MLFLSRGENIEFLKMLCVGFFYYIHCHMAHGEDIAESLVAWIDSATAACSEEFFFRIPCSLGKS